MKKYYVLTALIGAMSLLPLSAEELLTAETYASYYGEAFNGRPTSSGEIFNMNAYTAAHKTLPFGTFLEVTNLENGKKVVVRVNDRGPFVANREIDLSKAAAESLGMISHGITRVSIKKVDSLDHAALMATNDVYSDAPAETVQTERAIGSNTQTEAVPLQQVGSAESTPSNLGTVPEVQVLQPNATQTSQPSTMQPNAAQSNATQPNTTQTSQPSAMQPNAAQSNATQPNTTQTSQSNTAQTQQTATDRQAVQTNSAQGVAPRSAFAPSEQFAPLVYSQGSSGVLWRIQLGAFVREENALRLVVQLRKAGFEPAYERTEKTVRVVLPGIPPADLEKVKEALANHAFTDYVIRQESW